MSKFATALSAALLSVGISSLAMAKTPGQTYCFNGVCHRVKTIAETQRMVGRTETVAASFYRDAAVDRFNPSNITSSGEYFRANRPDNAASPIYPNGTQLLVFNPRTGRAVVVRVNNAGPYWGNRKLDLSHGAARAIGMGGVGSVQVRVLRAPTHEEARYRLGRTYAPVAGFIGQFASLDSAYASTTGGRNPSFALAAASVQAPQQRGRPQPVRIASADDEAFQYVATQRGRSATRRDTVASNTRANAETRTASARRSNSATARATQRRVVNARTTTPTAVANSERNARIASTGTAGSRTGGASGWTTAEEVATAAGARSNVQRQQATMRGSDGGGWVVIASTTTTLPAGRSAALDRRAREWIEENPLSDAVRSITVHEQRSVTRVAQRRAQRRSVD